MLQAVGGNYRRKIKTVDELCDVVGPRHRAHGCGSNAGMTTQRIGVLGAGVMGASGTAGVAGSVWPGSAEAAGRATPWVWLVMPTQPNPPGGLTSSPTRRSWYAESGTTRSR